MAGRHLGCIFRRTSTAKGGQRIAVIGECYSGAESKYAGCISVMHAGKVCEPGGK